jgi:hypothetical protein
MPWLPWALYALTLFCFGYTFVAHSVPLALLAMLTALGSMIWATLLLAQARIAERSQSSMTLLGPEELAALRARAQAEAEARKESTESATAAPGAQADAQR